jgi:hypothetical protein
MADSTAFVHILLTENPMQQKSARNQQQFGIRHPHVAGFLRSIDFSLQMQIRSPVSRSLKAKEAKSHHCGA